MSNLKPVQSKEEARKRGRAGGIKSGEVRRQKKTLKSQLLLALADDATRAAVCNGLIAKAAAGDPRAFQIMRDTIGESPTIKHNVMQTEAPLLGVDFVAGLDQEQLLQMWDTAVEGGADVLSLDAKRTLFERMLSTEGDNDND